MTGGVNYEQMAVEAHEMARLAARGLESHEEVCAERYNGIHGSLDNLHASLLEYQRKEATEWSKLYSRMWSVSATIIVLLITGFGTLAWYVLTNNI